MNYYDDIYSTSRQYDMGTFPQTKTTPMTNVYSPMTMPMTMPMNMPMTMPMEQNTLPSLPTGVPAGGLVAPVPGPQGTTVLDMGLSQTTADNVQFVAGFLKTQIGRNMRVEFLIGTNGPLVDRIGTLRVVGTSYIILQPVGSREVIMCDLYSIRFVTIFPETVPNPQPY
jgi:hypothetical protein